MPRICSAIAVADGGGDSGTDDGCYYGWDFAPQE